MPIPYGLLGQTDIEKKKRGPFKPGEGYWLGSQYIFPEIAPAPSDGMTPPQQQPMFTPAPAAHPQGGILGPVWDGGDGGAGNGLGGGSPGATAPGQSPSFNEPGHVNAPDLSAAVSVGLPSLPSFQEQAPAPTAPTPGLAPAPGLQDLAVSEVDPQGPSGKGKGHSNVGPPGSATTSKGEAVAAAHGVSRSQVDKAVQEKGFMQAMKDALQPGRALMGDVSVAGLGIATNPEENASVSANVSGENAGMSTGGTDANGGPGSSGASGTSGTGPNAGDEGGLGAWRKGGPVPDDGDEKLEPVRGILHEREFVLRPEAAQYYGKGILGALNAKAIPKAKLSGLLRL